MSRRLRAAAGGLSGLLLLTVLGVALSACGGDPSQLAVQVTADARGAVKPGETPSYTVSVVNRGPGTASGVAVTVDLPSTMHFDSTTALPSDSDGASRTQPSEPRPRDQSPHWGDWILAAPVVQADGTVRRAHADISFTVSIDGSPGDYQIVPHVFSDNNDELVGPATAVSVDPAADLAVTVTAEQAKAKPGETISYRAVITNQGTGPGTFVDLLLTLPPGLGFDRTLTISGNSSRSSPVDPAPGSLEVFYGGFTVPAGSGGAPGLLTITFRAKVVENATGGRFPITGQLTDAAGAVIAVPDTAPITVDAPLPTPGASPRASPGRYTPVPRPSPTPH